MADEQPDIFISYSRANSEFVDRLDADLRARGFNVWVDRHRLEGGQLWAQEIDTGIARCDLFLLVLSPTAVESPYVRHEFEEAERLGKRLLPVVFKNCVIPAWLASADGTHRQDFTDTDPNAYLLNLKRLLFAIEDPTLNLSAPTDQLYNQALRLRTTNSESAAIILQHLIDREPAYFGGQPQRDLAALEEQLYTTRAAWLRARAQQARQEGQYGVEAASLGVLIALGNHDSDMYNWAQEYLPIAQQNRTMLGPYGVIQDRIADGDTTTARALLENLWNQAPYFRDPANLAPTLGLTLPPTYDHDKAAAAERKRFEKACALLQGDLSSKWLNDVRANLGQQNYDLDDPAASAAIGQMIKAWRKNRRLLAKSEQPGKDHTYSVEVIVSPEGCIFWFLFGLLALPGVWLLISGQGTRAVVPCALGLILGLVIEVSGFNYIRTAESHVRKRRERLQQKAIDARGSAEQHYERWRQLAERICQQRINAIER